METIYLTSFLPPSAPFTDLKSTSHPLPTPEPDHILIKVTHIAIQQVDLLYARGRHQNNHPKRGHIHPPFTLGLDFAGTVISTPESRSPTPATPSSTPSTSPSGPRRFKPGDAVFGSHPGAFATHLALPASSLRHIPAGLPPSDAAALVGGVVSFAAVRDVAAVRAGQTVLVTGVPGNLAVVAAQVAVAAGARVVCLARTEGRAAAVRGMLGEGVDVVGAEGEWVGRVRKVFGGRGVDVVIDNVGVVRESLSLLAFGGTVVLVGFAGRGGVMEKVEMNRVLLKGAKVIGFRFGEGIRKQVFDGEACWDGYLKCLQDGSVEAVVDSRPYNGLGEVGRAMEDLERGVLAGKAVVTVDLHAEKSRL